MNETFNEILSYAVQEGNTADIGLWEITSPLCGMLGVNSFKLSASDTEKLFESLSEFIPLLLQSGFVAGNFENKKDYIVWPDQNPAAVVDKIKQEWFRRKGMMPDVNFIAFFRKVNKQPVKRRG